MDNSFSNRVKTLIKGIPYGKIATYGQLATSAGNPRAARQVAWLLHSSSKKDNLPWHRVINSRGYISLPRFKGYELQKQLLLEEGIEFGENDFIDLKKYQWRTLK
ncbi:MAG: MGMT family protein [Candidatus Hodarchaeota archaeon]